MVEPRMWSRIDKVASSYKPFLRDDDVCFYYLQKDNLGYSAGPHASENQMIINFKHDPAKYGTGTYQWRYKQRAINDFASAVVRLLMASAGAFKSGAMLVPIPTSKPRGSEGYDTRLDDLCSKVAGTIDFAFYCPAFDTITDKGKAHYGAGSRDPDKIRSNMSFDAGLLKPGAVVVLIDDVITTGAHYAACRDAVRAVKPDAPILGLFLSIQLPSWDESDRLDWEDSIEWDGRCY